MRFPQIALLLVAILAVPAAAQQSANPVTAHYRAYRAALERGDLATADTESTAALETAQLDLHSAGTVAALAMNVALVRLSEGHRAQALSPAQLAASLAGNASSHVDPLAVDIAIKRASLQIGDQSEAQLLAALNAAHEHGGLDEYVYDGASDLGGWAYQQHHLRTTADAWRLASQSSPGDSDAAVLSRARALLGLGVVLFQADQASAPEQVAMFDSQVSTTNDEYRPNIDALEALAEAGRIARPLASRPGANGEMTQAQQVFSRATVFFLAAQSRASTYNVPDSVLQDRPFDHFLAIPASGNTSRCTARLSPDARPEYPTHAVFEGNVGAVMVRVVVDEAGHASDAHLVASVGGQEFTRAIERVLPRWRVVRADNAPANCSMAMTLFTTVVFRLAAD
jgi:TonB family protein